jgi:FtsH-binding integral membrane protein
MGSLAFMTLIGLIVVSLVNMFLHSSGLEVLISYVTVLVFCALTASDTQRIKQMAAAMPGDNIGIYGALSLYLKFINIFLALLRIFGGGDRRN